jgi:hypothetical protein
MSFSSAARWTSLITILTLSCSDFRWQPGKRIAVRSTVVTIATFLIACILVILPDTFSHIQPIDII